MPAARSTLILLMGDCPPAAAALAATAETLAQFGLPFTEAAPGQLLDLAARVVIVASADAALPTMASTQTGAPVIRVPFTDNAASAKIDLLAGSAAWESEQHGVFATVAIGEAGARNAALLAVSILALTDDRLRAAYDAFRQEQTDAVLRQPPPVCKPS